MKTGFIDRLLERLDRIDTNNLHNQFLRLVREKGLLETIFHSIQEGIIVVDGRQRVAYTNRAAEMLLGFSGETAEGEPIGRIFRGIEWDLLLRLDEQEWSTLVSREIEISYPEHRFLDFYVVPLKLMSAQEEGALVLLRDITKTREDAERNRESDRLQTLTLLAAGVAHELGNPLNSLNIHLQLLERDIQSVSAPQRERLNESVQVAKREVARLDQIIHQFLRAIRPIKPQLEPAQIADILQECLDFMQQEIEDRGVWVKVESEHDLPTVQVDRTQIKQAFFNLIKNAIQAMSDGGVLKIELSSSDRFVTIAFRDTGPGISQETMGAIFEPFYTTKSGGSGLGLMIVQRIIREHGGELEVESAPGKGTTFRLFLLRENQRVRLLNAPQNTKEPEVAV